MSVAATGFKSWKATRFSSRGPAPIDVIRHPNVTRLALTHAAMRVPSELTTASLKPPSFYEKIIKPDISAPGARVRAAYPGNDFKSLSGTSMASRTSPFMYNH